MFVSIKDCIAQAVDGGGMPDMVLLISGHREQAEWCQIELLIVLILR